MTYARASLLGRICTVVARARGTTTCNMAGGEKRLSITFFLAREKRRDLSARFTARQR